MASTPVVLMGYANPIEAMGYEAFAAAAAQEADVDGVLVVDYPPEESTELVGVAQDTRHRLHLSCFSDIGRRRIRAGRRGWLAGYIYYVSLKGVTGAAHIDLKEVKAKLPQYSLPWSGLPIGVGFGIRDAQTAKAVASVSDAVVIGSRLVQEIENSGDDERIVGNLSILLADFRAAMDSA